MIKKKEIIVIVSMITDFINKIKYKALFNILLSIFIVSGIGYYAKNNISCIDKIACDTSCIEVKGRYYEYEDYDNSIVFDGVNYAKPNDVKKWYKTFNYNEYYKIIDSCRVFVVHKKEITNIKNTYIINYEYKSDK